MTVQELIYRLSEYDPTQIVTIWDENIKKAVDIIEDIPTDDKKTVVLYPGN